MTLYSDDIREFVRSRRWPPTVAWQIAEATEPEPHLNLIFFRDNWLTLSFDDQLAVTGIVKEIMAKCWGDGIPCYTGKMENSRA